MSGLEVVGVVLGSIPLVVSALECYADGVSTIKAIVQYENVLLDIQVRLVTSMAIFKQTCEELLRGLVMPDVQFRDLVEYQKGWDDRGLAEALRRRLGDKDFIIFKVLAKRVHRRLVLMGRKLRLRDDLTAPFMDGDVVDEKRRREMLASFLWRTRISGGFNAGKHQRNCAEIRDDISQLRDLVHGALNLESERHERPSLLPPAHWRAFHGHADRIYHTLRGKWWHPYPSHIHRASLRLDPPGSYENTQHPTKLNLSFSIGYDEWPALMPLGWQDATVLSMQAPASTPLITGDRTSDPSASSKSGNECVKFAVPALKVSPDGGWNHEKCNSTHEIDDLCTSLSQPWQKECIGFLTSQEWHYHLHDARTPLVKTLQPLHDIFHRKSRAVLNTKERCSFAVTLALAVLRLHDTPWLSSNWNIGQIYVHHDGVPGLYVIKAFESEIPEQSQSLNTTVPIVKNEALFSLGVALLELAHGKPLSSFQAPEDLDEDGNEHFWTRYLVADRLTKEIQENEPHRFAYAVGKCIHPSSDTYDFELSDDGFRNRFFNDVIRPLQEDYQILFPHRAR